MSSVFYDHIIVLIDIESEIKSIAETLEEKEELWQLVDEIIHHEMLCCILDNLHEQYHEEFLDRFHQAPHDHLILEFLSEKIGVDVEEIIKERVERLKDEILQKISLSDGQ